LKKGLEVRKKFANHPRIRIIFAPHAPYTVSDDTFNEIKKIMEPEDRIHIHVHETKKEIEDSVAQYGCRPLERLHKLGLLNDKVLAVHLTQLNDKEIQLLAKTGVHVIHCPESNMKLGSGVCPVAKLLSAGANVCLGTDGPASNDDLDLLGEMRTSALVDKLHAEDISLPAWQMLQMGTINGAKALGMADRIGSLEKGKDADIVAIRLTAHPVYNPINSLVFVGTNKIEYVWVEGQCLLEQGQMKTLDLGKIYKEANEWRNKIIQWDHQRKTADLGRVKTVLKEVEGLSEVSSVKELQDAQQKLGPLKDSLWHWTFFAGRGEKVGASLQDLQAASKLLNERNSSIESFLKKV
jgi:5-methylthioadenosine/S-adenosylhomocysteine deaminase